MPMFRVSSTFVGSLSATNTDVKSLFARTLKPLARSKPSNSSAHVTLSAQSDVGTSRLRLGYNATIRRLQISIDSCSAKGGTINNNCSFSPPAQINFLSIFLSICPIYKFVNTLFSGHLQAVSTVNNKVCSVELGILHSCVAS